MHRDWNWSDEDNLQYVLHGVSFVHSYPYPKTNSNSNSNSNDFTCITINRSMVILIYSIQLLIIVIYITYSIPSQTSNHSHSNQSHFYRWLFHSIDFLHSISTPLPFNNHSFITGRSEYHSARRILCIYRNI